MEQDYKHKLMGMVITKIRKKKNIKAKHIALAIGQTPASVSKMESGHLRISSVVLNDIAAALGVTVTEMYEVYSKLLEKYEEVIIKVELDYLALAVVHNSLDVI